MVYSADIPGSGALPCVRFQLPQSSDWIKARGQIAWTSETKKEAGIQFVDLPDLARKQIREWIAWPNHANDFAVSPPEDSTPLAIVPPGPADRSSTGIRELTPAPDSCAAPLGRQVNTKPPEPREPARSIRRSSPGLYRRLRVLIERRKSSRAPRTAGYRRIWRGFLVVVSLLALLSFAVGLVASRGKLSDLLGTFAKMARHAAASEENPPGDNETPSTVAGPAQRSATAPEIQRQGARVMVTTRLYVPVSYSATARTSRVESLQVGRIDHRVDPEYPPQAISQGIEGTVELRASISATGGVHSILVLSGPPLLTPSAADAVRSWRYTPTLLSGKPVEAEADIAIVFWLPAGSRAHQAEK